MGGRICRTARQLLGLYLLGSLLVVSQTHPSQDNDEKARQFVERFSNELPNSDDKQSDWNEIFAEEYKQLLDSRENENDDDLPFSGRMEVVEEWPVTDQKLGQIGGLATDNDGHIIAFHRADRTWEPESFDEKNIFTTKKDGPIKQPTIYIMNVSNGIVLNKLGANLFYLPHGLFVDKDGNMWMTDVAMHQVFKFEPGKSVPSLTLGKQFEPAQSNEDKERFCKPTDIAVSTSGDIFVSDGYCASRVMKFDKTGKFVAQFGVDDFQIPHSLALIEELDLICVADRENMRVLCYNAGIEDATKLGEPEREYTDEQLGRVYGITYSPVDGLLYGVTGPTGVLIPTSFSVDLKEDGRYKSDIVAVWSPDDKGFDNPHDIAVTPDGGAVFVGEIKPDVVWKFMKEVN